MRQLLMLLLPGLVPSWAFFKAIEPSPRVQWRLLERPDGKAGDWHEYRPRPTHVSVAEMVRRLFWNPRWNETLYMVSLAERLTIDPTPHSTDGINRQLASEIRATRDADPNLFLQFQLIFVSREPRGLEQTIMHVSDPLLLQEIAA